MGRNGQNRETNIGRNTAIALASPYSDSGRNLTVDNFFTDMELSAHLLTNNMTLVQTVRRNKRFLPQEFQTGQGLKKGDAIFGFQKKTTIVAYKSNKKKHVAVLSTMNHDDNFDVETRKPEIMMAYNATKGGVDSMNQMCHAVTTKRKTNRWPMLLFYVLDLASIAVLVLWHKVNPSEKLSDEDRRVLFKITVAKELVRLQLECRQIMKNLSRHLKFTINAALHQHPTQAQVGEVSTPDNRKRGQCHLCPRHQDLKTTMRCSKSSVCSTHSKKQSVSPVKNKTNFFFQKTKGMPTRC